MTRLENITLLKSISKNLSVLFVEDEEGIREGIYKFLKKFFLHVDVASNGEEGLEKYNQFFEENKKHYDIVFSDINMPRLNGVEMCQAIKEIHPTQKIIIISAHDDRNSLLNLLDIGVDGFLTKPFNATKALDVLTKVCTFSQINNINYFNALMENSIVEKLDKDGNFIYVNEKMCELSGYKKEELLGKHIRILNHSKDPKPLFDTVKESSYPATVIKKRMIKRKKDGSEFITDTTLIPLLDSNGEVNEYTVLRDDVTNEVKLQEEMLKKEKEEEIREKVEKAKETFLLIFTHELKTPLNSIINFSKYMKQAIQKFEIEEKSKFLKLSNAVVDNATDMLLNVTQMLEISKIKSNKLKYNYNNFSLNNSLKKMISQNESTLSEKNIEVTMNLQKELSITSDMLRVEQIISNIISNAIKYGKDKIIITLNEDEEKTYLSIEDNGNGIKNKKEVFELFTQEDETTLERQGKGTGIGLNFVKMVCEDLNISYALEDSNDFGGCKFVFSFSKKIR